MRPTKEAVPTRQLLTCRNDRPSWTTSPSLFSGLGTIDEHIKAGKLRALAVTSMTRSAALPDIPTVSDTLRGFQASGWWGVGAPKDTPTEIIDKLNREISAGLTDAKIRAQLSCTPGR